MAAGVEHHDVGLLADPKGLRQLCVGLNVHLKEDERVDVVDGDLFGVGLQGAIFLGQIDEQ